MRTYPKSDAYDIAETLGALGTGEALVTVLGERGAPTPVAWTMLRAPRSTMAPLEPTAQQQAVAASPLQARYGQPLDRESAYERLAERMRPPAPTPAPEPAPPRRRDEPAASRRRPRRDEPADDSVLGSVLASSAFRSFARSAASALGREVTRGIFGTRRRR